MSTRPRRVRLPWTPEQEDKLAALLNSPAPPSYKEIARLIGRTPQSVCSRLAARPQLEAHKQEVIADYLAATMPVIHIAAKYGVSNDTVTTQLKRWGVYDPNREFTFINRKNQYDCWVETLGREGADVRYAAYCESHKRGARKGPASPQYGKPPPNGTGNGWKGWYREQFFRSLREACFMIEMEGVGTIWATGETLHIPYVFNGKDCTYRPDFLIGNRVIEIKPARLHSSPRVSAKHDAATAYCEARGLTYELIDVAIDARALLEALNDGRLRFDRDYRDRFMRYIGHNGVTGAEPPGLETSTAA